MYHSIGTSRNILMIRNNISYICRYNSEDDILSTIWVEINLKKNRKLLLCGAYRQWRLPLLMDPNKTSNSKNSQIDRLNSFLGMCSKAI